MSDWADEKAQEIMNTDIEESFDRGRTDSARLAGKYAQALRDTDMNGYKRGYQEAQSEFKAEIERLRELFHDTQDELLSLSDAVTTKRERCAKEADYYAAHSVVARSIAKAIRANR